MKSFFKNKTKSLLLFILLTCVNQSGFSQSNPHPLKPGIQIERLLTIKNGAIRLVMDSVENNLIYATTNGNIYKIISPSGSAAYDSLIFTAADHGVQYVQGMDIHDSTLYISGNNDSGTPLTTGLIVRGKLSSGGTRVWSQVMITDPYETADYFDHLFSGLVVSPDGDSIYICSGARGDHGEIQDRYGMYPGLRNLPLTTNIFVIPTMDTAVVVLKNDSAWHDTSAYVYCKGIRNTFDMAFDASGNLFGVENSGDRDHNEEMNWLRRGYHYGFPWKMGDTENPQQFPSFIPANDLLISHYSKAWRNGFWTTDSTFPAPAPGLLFQDPIQNYGPDCDKFRDSLTGDVMDASDLGMHMGTFTAHRSPLGLVFDRDSVLHPAYRGDAFMLSWTEGLDSCGCRALPDTGIGPFIDPSQDLVHLDMAFDSTIDNFRLNATRIVESFSHPVDAVIKSNRIYVLENGYGGTSGLYAVDMPLPQACQLLVDIEYSDSCYALPALLSIHNTNIDTLDMRLYDSTGLVLHTWPDFMGTDTFSVYNSGFYYILSQNFFGCFDSLGFNVTPETMVADQIQVDVAYSDSCYLLPALIDISNTGTDSIEINLFDSTGFLMRSWNGFTGNDTISVYSSGAYYILASNAIGCSDSVGFIIHDIMDMTIDSTHSASCIGCSDGVIYFHVENGVGTLSYTSIPLFGTFAPDSLSDLPAGNYLICITDTNMCQKCDTVTVIEPPENVNQKKDRIGDMRLHPNPAGDVLHLNFDHVSGLDYYITISDIIGNEYKVEFLFRALFSGTEQASINTSNLGSGIYFLSIHCANCHTITKRFSIVK